MKKPILYIATAIIAVSCGVHHKISGLRGSQVSADLALSEESFIPLLNTGQDADKDTMEVSEPESVLIMNAIKDENGEMTATDVIRAAVVTARFRNVAERHGKVDLRFQVIVPKDLQDSRWQLQLHPDMFIMEDSVRLEPVIITGAQYRRRQLRGYEQYQRFLDSIISDSTRLVNAGQLELFIKRNIPELYRFKTDSTEVSDTEFASVYGVTEKAAIEHYTNGFLVRKNARKQARSGKMYAKYVKAPIVREGIRLDTIITTPDGDFIYDYTQTINTCPGLKKADIKISGNIYENGDAVLAIPQSRPITFYISSLSSFTDMSEKYLTRVVSRRVEANTACYVDFPYNRSDIDPDLGNNRTEIGRIQKNLVSLASDKDFDLDSIIVTAYSSPEGSVQYNEKLSRERAASICGHFDTFLRHCRDSLRREEGFSIDFSGGTEKSVRSGRLNEISFISKSYGENWQMLDLLVDRDSTLTEGDKEAYCRLRTIEDADRREAELSMQKCYTYLRSSIYPKLRAVKFDFHLHRKGMVQDTVRTTVLDTAYMAGVQAIIDRDYTKAISVLTPYHDFNLAVAYCAMDYNASAMDILQGLEKTDKVCYMLALVYSRIGQYQAAAEHYKKSCDLNPTFVHRGNLDPEISALIKMFNLNQDEEQ